VLRADRKVDYAFKRSDLMQVHVLQLPKFVHAADELELEFGGE
jgi:hypothetical protein